jgi:hypothetical protein
MSWKNLRKNIIMIIAKSLIICNELRKIYASLERKMDWVVAQNTLCPKVLVLRQRKNIQDYVSSAFFA